MVKHTITMMALDYRENGENGTIKDARKKEYRKLQAIYRSQEGRQKSEKHWYAEGSYRFNRYVHGKRQGKTKKQLQEILKEEFEFEVIPHHKEGKSPNKHKYDNIHTIKELEKDFERVEKGLFNDKQKILENIKITSGQNLKHYDLHKGETYVFEGFTSGSVSPHEAEGFVNKNINKGNEPVRLKVNIPEGTELIPVLGNGMHINEAEFIIPEGTKVEVINRTKNAEDGIAEIEIKVISD